MLCGECVGQALREPFGERGHVAAHAPRVGERSGESELGEPAERPDQWRVATCAGAEAEFVTEGRQLELDARRALEPCRESAQGPRGRWSEDGQPEGLDVD